MSPDEVRALEDRTCLAYPKLLPVEAHKRTQHVAGVTAWRCTFGGGHWHAEALSLAELVDMAEVLRDRHNGHASPIDVA